MVTFEEAVNAMKEKRPVYYIGNSYDVVYCKESSAGDTVMIKRRSLNNQFDSIEIEPWYLTTKEVGHV